MPKKRFTLWRPSRRSALLGLIIVGCLVYLLLPKALWLKRKLDAIDEATARTSIVLGKPAENWQTLDLDGSEHSLTEYKGRIVVLDFWYSSCSWCLRSMPQLNELAEEFEDRPVTFLGVNSDAEPADARRVLSHFKLKHPILCNQNDTNYIDKLYRVEMYPTVLVLDQNGIVRHVHCGYWPTMKSSLSKKIRELLVKD